MWQSYLRCAFRTNNLHTWQGARWKPAAKMFLGKLRDIGGGAYG
jgi:hypothetical protein